MKSLRTTILPILIASVWISVSEYVRNSYLLHVEWLNHYENMGIRFPEDVVNGAIWGIWSLCFAILIFILNDKFTKTQTFFLSWFVGFFMMWLVIWNLGVLPLTIIPVALPLSLIEVFVAVFIIHKFSSKAA